MEWDKLENLDIQVGLKLKELRDKLSLSVREVGSRIGIDYSYVSKIEKGKLPSLDVLKKMCDLYGISIQSLFGEKAEVPIELKSLGVKWISIFEKAENENISPNDLEDMVNFLIKHKQKS